MRATQFLLEYNLDSLLKTFGDKLLAKWLSEGKPFEDEIIAANTTDDEKVNKVTAAHIIKWFEQSDPTQNDRYMTWIVGKYAGKKNGIQRMEDIPTRTRQALDRYERLKRKKKLKPDHSDINRFKRLIDLETIVDEYSDEDTSSGSEAEKEIEQGLYDRHSATLIYNDDTWKIIISHSEEASKYFGKNTKWCTTSGMHSQYAKDGPLYIILNKPSNKRWQWHFESMQYMDEMDSQIDLKEFIRTNKTPTHAIMKHYGGLDAAATTDPRNWFAYLKNPSEDAAMSAFTVIDVKEIEPTLRRFSNPSEKLKIMAITRVPDLINRLGSPSEGMKIAAVRANPELIGMFENPSDRLFLAVINKTNGMIIATIPNPSEGLQIAAVTRSPQIIGLLNEPSELVQVTAIDNSLDAIKYMKNPSIAVQLKVVNSKPNGTSIRLLKNPSEEAQLAAVTASATTIQYIDNPTEAAQLIAVKKEGMAIAYIKNPPESVQRAAILQNPNSVRYIKRLLPAMRKLAMANMESADLEIFKLIEKAGLQQ